MKNLLLSGAAVVSAIAAHAVCSYKAELTVSGYSGSEELVNFPVLVRLSPTTVSGFDYSRCQADGVVTT